MLKNQYAKNTHGAKCQNTHGPKLWLLDTWAWAHGLGQGPGPGPAPPLVPTLLRRRHGPRPGPMGQALGPGHGLMPMCPGAKVLAHEYFDIWVHKYV